MSRRTTAHPRGLCRRCGATPPAGCEHRYHNEWSKVRGSRQAQTAKRISPKPCRKSPQGADATSRRAESFAGLRWRHLELVASSGIRAGRESYAG